MPNLTEKAIEALGLPPGKREAWLSDAKAKGLRVRATAGAKTFYACWTDKVTGERQREKLGPWGALTLEQAREAARIVLGDVAKGKNPAAEREAERQRRKAEAEAETFTLDRLIEDWTQLHLVARRPSYARRAPRILRNAFPSHLAKPAASLTHAAVVAQLDRRVAEGQPNAARLILAAGRACYGWAVKRRRLAANPFQGLPRVEGAYVERERFLADDELGEVWRAAGTLPAPYGPLIRFQLLTLARGGEVTAMTWGEVADDLSSWTQPAAKTKNGRAHVVHLAPAARAILRAQRGEDRPPPEAPVFAALTQAGVVPVSGVSWVKRKLDKAMEAERTKRAAEAGVAALAVPAWVLHDFRRSGVTWLASAGFPPHVADRLLNHTAGTIRGVQAVYQRHDFAAERKAALEAWAAHVLALGEGQKPVEKVVKLRARRRA